MNRKFLIPILVALAGIVAFVLAAKVLKRPAAKEASRSDAIPRIEVVEVSFQTVPLSVKSHGTAQAGTSTVLSTRVGGRIEALGKNFAEGGFFKRGEILVRLEDQDYRLVVAQAQSELARAQTQLARVEAAADLARQDWEEMGQGEATPLVLQKPQVVEAKAAVEAAEAALSRAQIDLRRTEVRAPFEGRIRRKLADLGQTVGSGVPLAEIFSTTFAEVKLPLADDRLAFLDIPLGEAEFKGPQVVLRSDFAGRSQQWRGQIVRTGGELDPVNRMVQVIARVEDPYGQGRSDLGEPLLSGLFVEAEIEGRVLQNAMSLPRQALRDQRFVLVVDETNHLYRREVTVVRQLEDEVIISGGLEADERVCISPLSAVIDGMEVHVINEDEGP